MTFYFKLTKELKKQFKTSNIAIPETRAKCVAIAQRVWEGLHSLEEKRGFRDPRNRLSPSPSTSSKYPRPNSGRDRKDRYHLDHRSKDNQNKERPRNEPSSKKGQELICFECNKPGHYATSCPNRKKLDQKARIQSIQQERDPSDSPTSSRASTEPPRVQSETEDSSDSLN
jgi:Zinc knuckle